MLEWILPILGWLIFIGLIGASLVIAFLFLVWRTVMLVETMKRDDRWND